jgi:hypothetical protein
MGGGGGGGGGGGAWQERERIDRKARSQSPLPSSVSVPSSLPTARTQHQMRCAGTANRLCTAILLQGVLTRIRRRANGAASDRRCSH